MQYLTNKVIEYAAIKMGKIPTSKNPPTAKSPHTPLPVAVKMKCAARKGKAVSYSKRLHNSIPSMKKYSSEI